MYFLIRTGFTFVNRVIVRVRHGKVSIHDKSSSYSKGSDHGNVRSDFWWPYFKKKTGNSVQAFTLNNTCSVYVQPSLILSLNFRNDRNICYFIYPIREINGLSKINKTDCRCLMQTTIHSFIKCYLRWNTKKNESSPGQNKQTLVS